MTPLRRGDVVLVSLDPAVGSEANKTRPCVIVNNSALAEVVSGIWRGMLTVVPLTSNTERLFGNEVLLTYLESGLPRDSKAQVQQVRAIDIRRVSSKVGRIPAIHMAEIDDALMKHLSLWPS